MIKDILKSPRLEDHMETIGINQSLGNSSSFEQNFLNNIKKIYQHAGKSDDQQNLKDVLDAAKVLNTEEVTYDILHVTMTSTQFKKQGLVNHYVYSLTY